MGLTQGRSLFLMKPPGRAGVGCRTMSSRMWLIVAFVSLTIGIAALAGVSLLAIWGAAVFLTAKEVETAGFAGLGAVFGAVIALVGAALLLGGAFVWRRWRKPHRPPAER